MGTETAFTILSSLLSILGIIYLIFWRYRSLSTNWFRQRVFELRDELFDYAASGNIGFDERAYGMLRKTMNGYIRFAHQTTGWHGLIFGAFFRKADRRLIQKSYDEYWAEGLARLNPEAKREIECLRERLEKLAMVYFLLSAPELVLLLLPLLLILLVLALITGVLIRIGVFVADSPIPQWARRLKAQLRFADDVAMIYGA